LTATAVCTANASLVVDGLVYELRRSPKRTTIGITVDRDGSLILSAPDDCPLATIEETARKKQLWVHTKLTEKRLLFRSKPPKEYVTGESFHHLGRSYRLLLVDALENGASIPALRLRRGRFELRRDERRRAGEHFIAWYVRNGYPWIQRRVDLLSDRIGASPAAVNVRELGYRWGSCSPGGNLNFHWSTICLPPRIVEYVVVHELVHLIERHHGPEFWQRLQRTMPDFADRKRWLAENSARYVPLLTGG
jgi:predicted metal-dependent hydrolase